MADKNNFRNLRASHGNSPPMNSIHAEKLVLSSCLLTLTVSDVTGQAFPKFYSQPLSGNTQPFPETLIHQWGSGKQWGCRNWDTVFTLLCCRSLLLVWAKRQAGARTPHVPKHVQLPCGGTLQHWHSGSRLSASLKRNSTTLISFPFFSFLLFFFFLFFFFFFN